jgi:hypothetical protein
VEREAHGVEEGTESQEPVLVVHGRNPPFLHVRCQVSG